jgi:Ser/Thr protein kinase RdoA (MazF antagonist)
MPTPTPTVLPDAKRAEAALCASDTALPGLRLLLDPAALGARLQALLPGEPPLQLAPAYLRYKRGTSAVAGVQLRCADAAALDLSVKALPPARFEITRQRPRFGDPAPVDASSPQAPRALADMAMLAHGPAHDPDLPALRRLLDPEQQARGVHRLLGRPDPAVAATELHTLRYKPGRRWVACLRTADGTAAALLRVVEADAFDGAVAGARFAAAQGGPALLGVMGDRCAFASAWVPGRSLAAFGDALPPPGELAELGVRLATLHRSGDRPARQRERADEVAALWRAVQGLAEILPALAPTAQRVAERVAAALAAAPVCAAALHGDFAPDQVVRSDDDAGRFTLIDWDQAATGDAAADLGSFVARLGYHALTGEGCADTARAAAAALVSGHAAAFGQVPAALPAQTAAALLRLLGEGFRRRRADWPALAHALLGLAEQALQARGPLADLGGAAHIGVGAGQGPTADDESASTASADTTPPGPTPCDPALPALATALQPAAMRPWLAQALGVSPLKLQVAGLRLQRHKPGRRALVACTVAMHGADRMVRVELLAKLRAKGLDRRAPQVQQGLHDAGFAAEQGAAVVVPAVRGCVPELGLWLQARMAGTSLTRWLDQPDAPGLPALLGRAGQALAHLHAHPQPTDRRWTVADELQGLAARFASMASARPDLAARLQRLLARCEALAAGVPASQTTGLHRDFYPDQVLVDGERLVLLDFDLYAQGPAALDAGNFLAHLVEHALRRLGRATPCRRPSTPFAAPTWPPRPR